LKKTAASLLAFLMIVLAQPLYAEDGFFSWLFSLERKNEVAPVADETYIEECGACHFPYQPGLLPEASWRKLISPKALEDHFGENAELDEATRVELENFLVSNSADKSHFKRSKKIMASLKPQEAPLRITEVRFIKRKHHELKDKHVKNNEKVKSLSNCDRCHRQAEDAIFDDDTVDIPNFGKWTW
jgi:hypothetical protein